MLLVGFHHVGRHSGRIESCIVTLAFLAEFVAICPRKSERDLRFSGKSLCSKEEEVVIEEGEEKKKGNKVRHYIEKQTQGNHRSVGVHTRHTRMHSWNKSMQHSAA